MKTANAMQLKARIKARAKEAHVSPQLMLQDYLLERLLERVSLSEYRANVVVKGGMLISSLIGVENRVTKDLDTTVRGFALTHDSAERAFRTICAVEVDDGLSFHFVRTEEIREVDEYPGIRVYVKAVYPPLEVPLSIDVTTGDAITPDAIEYQFPLAFDDYSVSLMAYPVATVLAEKLETVIVRGVANTRPRDYYDIHKILAIRESALDLNELAAALNATAERRGSRDVLDGYRAAMGLVVQDRTMLSRWSRYAKDYSYVGDLSLQRACDDVVSIMDKIKAVARR